MRSPSNGLPAELPARLLAVTRTAVALLLVFSVCTVSIAARWPRAVLEAGVCALGALWAVTYAIAAFRIRGGPVLLLAVPAVYSAAQLLSGATEYRHATLEATLYWISLGALALLARQALSSPGARRNFRLAMAWFGSLLSALALLQMATSPGRIFWVFPTPYEDGVLGPFVNRNHFAALVVLLLPAALYECGKDSRWILGAGAMLCATAAGGSRAGTALAIAEVAVFAVLGAAAGRIPRRKAAAAMGITAAAAIIAGSGELKRWPDLGSFELRREVLRSAAEMIRERPLAGFGMGTWETVYPAYARFDDGRVVDHAHNDWAEWTAEGGVFMLLVLLAVAAASVHAAMRAPWTLGVAGVLLHALVDYPLHKPAIAAWTVVVFAAACSAAVEPRCKRPLHHPGVV